MGTTSQVHAQRAFYSPSIYSQEEVPTHRPQTVPSVPQADIHDQDPAAEHSLIVRHGNPGKLAVVKFMRFNEGRLYVEREVSTSSGNDRTVERAASEYISQGLFSFSTRLRSLTASQCQKTVLEDQSGMIVQRF